MCVKIVCQMFRFLVSKYLTLLKPFMLLTIYGKSLNEALRA